MVALSFDDKERVYFHLGMGARIGIDAGDLAQVEEACNTIFSEYMKTEILDQLDICDDAYDAMKATKTTTVRFGTKEFISRIRQFSTTLGADIVLVDCFYPQIMFISRYNRQSKSWIDHSNPQWLLQLYQE